MAITTLKLPDEVKKRIAPLARSTGMTPHGWMVQTLERESEREARHEHFVADSLAAAAELEAGGKRYAANDVETYLLAKASGAKTKRPAAMSRPRRR